MRDYLIPLQHRVTTVYLMVCLGREKACICLGEVIVDTWQEYILNIVFGELIKIVSDSYDPIYFDHVFNRNITINIVYEVTPKRF